MTQSSNLLTEDFKLRPLTRDDPPLDRHTHAHTHTCTDLGELRTRMIIDLFSKAKAAKLIRELVDLFLDMDKTTGHEVERRAHTV